MGLLFPILKVFLRPLIGLLLPMVFGIGVIYLFTKSLHLLNLIFKLCLVKGRALKCYPCGAINFVLGATHYRKLGFKLFATIHLRFLKNKLPLGLLITWVKRDA